MTAYKFAVTSCARSPLLARFGSRPSLLPLPFCPISARAAAERVRDPSMAPEQGGSDALVQMPRTPASAAAPERSHHACTAFTSRFCHFISNRIMASAAPAAAPKANPSHLYPQGTHHSTAFRWHVWGFLARFRALASSRFETTLKLRFPEQS